MYKRVAEMKPVAEIYEAQLIKEGVITKEQSEQMKDHVRVELERAYEASKSHKFAIEEWTSEEWEGIKQVNNKASTTGV